MTGLLEDLLVRLRVRCDVASITSGPGATLKQALLILVARLLEPQGAISLAMGPLDAQCCLLGTLLAMCYEGLDRMHTPLAIISSTGNEQQVISPPPMLTCHLFVTSYFQIESGVS